MDDDSTNARTWAKGLEDGIAPDQHLAVMPVRNLRVLIADLRRFADSHDAALAELRRLERLRCDGGIDGITYCAQCRQLSDEGHAPDCTLAAVLVRAAPPLDPGPAE